MASIWAAEADMDDELAEVDLNIAIGNYGSQETYDDSGQQIDESILLAMAQQQAALGAIPDVVKRFIVHFHHAVLENNLGEIQLAYESGWNKLTEKFYAKTEWPEAEIISPLVNDDQTFLILYRELYYRHVYSRLQPTVDDRFHAYENSCELFNYLLNSSDGPVSLELPEHWLWDIVDEFIYQFQSFCLWRAKPEKRTDEEIALLADASEVWSCYSVLNVLYSLVQKSRINEYIVAVQRGDSPEEIEELVGDFGSKPLYRMLGYFSLIGLLRVHVLLGDFTLALKVLQSVELTHKSSPITSRVTASHVAASYHVGVCYIAMGRYADGARTFASVLNFVLRMRQYHTRSYQYDAIAKTAERMQALLALCHALAPSRLDDQVLTIVRERYGDQLNRINRSSSEADTLSAFEELLAHSLPKFISAQPPPYTDPVALQSFIDDPPVEPTVRHTQLILTDVQRRAKAGTLRGFLKLYASLDAGKLAKLLDGEEEEMVQRLMALKLSSRALSLAPTTVASAGGHTGGGNYLDGTIVSTSDLDFSIDGNTVHVVESTVGRRYAGWFLRNTEHAQRVLDGLRKMPLPTPAPKATTSELTPAVPTAPNAGKTVAWGGVKVGA